MGNEIVLVEDDGVLVESCKYVVALMHNDLSGDARNFQELVVVRAVVSISIALRPGDVEDLTASAGQLLQSEKVQGVEAILGVKGDLISGAIAEIKGKHLSVGHVEGVDADDESCCSRVESGNGCIRDSQIEFNII